MKDVQCAESNEKSIFRFLFFELLGKFIENWGDFSTKINKKDHNSKNENRKYDFSFDSAHSVSFM